MKSASKQYEQPPGGGSWPPPDGGGYWPPQGGPPWSQPPPRPQQRYPVRPPPQRYPAPPPAPRRTRRGAIIFGIVISIPIILLVALFITIAFIGRPYVVRGSSMEPTLHEGDRVFVVKYNFGATPSRDDVVVIQGVGPGNEMLIKRVVAVEGDQVVIDNGTLTVNGTYVHKNTQIHVNEPVTIMVPDNTVFVMGDNEGRSYDSRQFGPVSMNNIVGHAVLIFWPLYDWKSL